MDKAIFILGPTGVGKSEMAILLAQKFDGEIISADSVQIFKGFDIGSGKISKSQMQGVIHHGIDLCQPNQEFSVFDFVQFTRQKITEICKKGRLPIVVGGTGLYVKSMLEGYNFGDVDKHQDFRQEQENFAKENGNLALWEKLNQIDNVAAAKISPNNTKRVVRALEVATFGGEKKGAAIDFDFKAFALTLDREKLYAKINARVDQMVKDGLFDEVARLLKSGARENYQPMQAIGYKEVALFLSGQISNERAIELVKQHSRNYAKRQMTFIRGMKDIEMIDVYDKNAALKALEEKINLFLKEKN